MCAIFPVDDFYRLIDFRMHEFPAMGKGRKVYDGHFPERRERRTVQRPELKV